MATGAIIALSAASLGITAASIAGSAKAADAQADAARDAGKEAEKAERTRGARQAGKPRVAFAKSGVDQVGTPLDVLGQAAEDAELNALRAKFGFDQRASLIESQQDQRVLQGVADITGTILGSVGALDNAGAFSSSSTPLKIGSGSTVSSPAPIGSIA